MMLHVDPVTPRNGLVATLRDVAALAGVHTATASRALSPETRSLVNEETARRVHDAAVALRYRPNPIARGLKTNRSYTIGVVVPDLRNPLFPPIARGIEEELEPAGYTSLLANTDNDPDRERLSFDALRARQVDGFVSATANRVHPLLRDLHDAGLPLVLVNRRMDDDEIPSVVPDDRGGMHAAIAHLAELGHRRIAHIGGSHSTTTGVERHAGFHGAMAVHGLEVDPGLVLVGEQYSEAEGARMCRELLARDRTCTAIAAGNDLVALGCIDALKEAGVACPDEVSVVGFNDMDWSDRFSPTLTTVRVPHDQLGRTAAAMLLERLAGVPGVARHEVVGVQLVVRGSSAVAAPARARA
jgi:LacI family transcriptional regulator